jgi:hypothetical protein
MMTFDELKQAARECLAKAFKGEDTTISSHIIQAAVSIALSPEQENSKQTKRAA